MKDALITLYQRRVILVGVILPSGQNLHLGSIDELALLAETAGAIVLDKATQIRKAPDPTFYIGKGKAEEIAELAGELNAQGIIFNADLSPSQIRNLESVTKTSVIDRTELILAIFSIHARSRQSKLQVDLAQMEYTLPRLKHLWGHLSRLAGGAGARTMRGPGEKQLEVDRRLAYKRIDSLKEEINQIQKRREQEVSARAEDFTVALVGYTNAGKSTLMNTLTGLKQLTEDKLFSTLDTKTHLWELQSKQKVLLSDTVGFIKNLPHHLVSSFHATLEEVYQADLLLHVVDASSREAEEQIQAVNEVLNEIGCAGKKTIIAFNKIDRSDGIELEILKNKFPDACFISALKGLGLDILEERIEEIIGAYQTEVSVRVPVENGRLMAYLHERGVILKKTLKDSYFSIKVRMGYRDLLKAQNLGLAYRKVSAKGGSASGRKSKR